MKKLLVKIIAKALEIHTRICAGLPYFRRAVRKAERLSKKNSRRTYVFFLGGKYRTLNRKDVQRLKNARVFKRDINMQKLSGVILYDTMTRANTHPQFKNVKL